MLDGHFWHEEFASELICFTFEFSWTTLRSAVENKVTQLVRDRETESVPGNPRRYDDERGISVQPC